MAAWCLLLATVVCGGGTFSASGAWHTSSGKCDNASSTDQFPREKPNRQARRAANHQGRRIHINQTRDPAQAMVIPNSRRFIIIDARVQETNGTAPRTIPDCAPSDDHRLADLCSRCECILNPEEREENKHNAAARRTRCDDCYRTSPEPNAQMAGKELAQCTTDDCEAYARGNAQELCQGCWAAAYGKRRSELLKTRPMKLRKRRPPAKKENSRARLK